jgi:hypothetical protein
VTTPENPEPTEADPPEENGAVAPDGAAVTAEPGTEQHAAEGEDTEVTEAPEVAPAEAATVEQAPVESAETAAAGTAVSEAAKSEAAKSETRAGEVAAADRAAEESPASEAAAQSSVSNGSATAASSGAWVSAAAPPWQRTGASVPSVDQPTVTLRLDSATQHADTETKPPPQESKKRFSGAYGFSTGVGPARNDAPNRYVHPVSQPMRDQGSQGAGQEFSQPTVRIGGYGQFDQAASSSGSGAAQPSAASRIRSTPRIPRRASLQLRYLEPWSVLKISLVLSVAGFLAWMVAVGILYGVLAGMGVWDQLNGTYSDLTSLNDPQAGAPLISAGGVFGVATLIGLVNVVLITAMCTVGAFIYNVSADLAGGIEVTLSERD